MPYLVKKLCRFWYRASGMPDRLYVETVSATTPHATYYPPECLSEMEARLKNSKENLALTSFERLVSNNDIFEQKKIRSTTKFADTTAQFWINELQDIILCQEDRSPQQCKLELIVCDSSFAGVQLHFQIHVWIYFYLWVLFNTYLLTWQVCCLWILTTRMDKHLQKPQKTSTQVGSKPQSLKLFDPTV